MIFRYFNNRRCHTQRSVVTWLTQDRCIAPRNSTTIDASVLSPPNRDPSFCERKLKENRLALCEPPCRSCLESHSDGRVQVTYTQEPGKLDLTNVGFRFQLPRATVEARSHQSPEEAGWGGAGLGIGGFAGAGPLFAASFAHVRPQYACTLVPFLNLGLRLHCCETRIR